MSTRKSRRGAKSEGINETLSETITKTGSPAEKQKKMRTRRQVTKASSLESDAEQSPETMKTRKRTFEETPGKATRSRKKVLLDNTVLDESEASVLSVGRTRRTRRGKENETLTDQTVLLDSTALDETSASRVNKSRGARARKKPAKKAESKSSDEDSGPSRRINASAAKNVTIIENSVDLTTTLDAGAPMSDEDTEVLQVSSRISRLRASAATPASPLPVGRRSRNVKPRLEDFTPESSPITVNLTPHRTTKTPRKSPMNLGSPKSHADAPLRLSKTPRKLPVVVESPAPSEMSVTSSTHSTPEKPAISDDLQQDESQKLEKSPKSPEKSPRRSPAKAVSVGRKFSKSPKIVLRSPKAKTAKSKTPRVTASKIKRSSLPKRSTKSPAKRSKSPVASPKKSPLSPRKSSNSPSPKKSREPLSPRKSAKDSIKSLGSPSLMSLQLARIDSPKMPHLSSPTLRTRSSEVQSPTVVLSKISPGQVETPENLTRSSLRRTPLDGSSKSTPVKSPSAEKRSSRGGESPPRPKSTGKKRAAITDSGTPLRPIDSPRSGAAAKLSAGKSVIISSSNTPVDVVRPKSGSGSGAQMQSSTPRERIRRSLNLSPGFGNPSEITVNSPMNGEVPAGSSTMIFEGRSKRRSYRIDDETNPLISEDESLPLTPRGSTTRLDGTYELEKDKDATVVVESEQDKTKNGTYELAEPKTPNLRRKAAKRSLGELDTSPEEPAVKRTCRVRFASPTVNGHETKTIAAVVGRSRSATPGHRTGIKRTASVSGLDVADSNPAVNKSRRRSNSMTNVSLLKTPVTAKRRSTSVSDANARSASRTAQNASVNRLSKPRLSIPSTKKPEVKTPVARKVPNFAQIHQKKFAQMESLVDAKKRVEKRHIAMSSKIPTNLSRVNSKIPTKPPVSSQPIAPVVAVNGGYNRYGFKLRKDDATKIITQKQPAHTSQKKQNENRLLLKGVRTNRRFDLIMKARNINI